MSTLRISIALFAALFVAGAAIAANGPNIGVAGVLPALPDDTMDDSLMRVKVDMAKRIQGHALIRAKTSDDWRFALDVGDGDFGAAIYGCPNQMKFDIGKNDITIFYHEVSPAYPELDFAECRRRLAAGDARSVHLAAEAANLKSGARDGRSGESWGGRLTFDFLAGRKFTDYREQLDFLDATATSFFKVDGCEESVSTFASHPAEVMVIRSTSLSDAIHCVLSRNPVKWKDKDYHPRFTMKDGLACLHMTMPSGDLQSPDEFIIAIACDGGAIVPMPGAAKSPVPLPASAPKGHAVTAHEFAAHQVRCQKKPVTFFVTVVTNRDVGGDRADDSVKGLNLIDVANARLKRAMDKGYDALRREHLQWWRNYWKRSWVMMNEKIGESPWYFSLYKAGSARRCGKIPPAYCAPWRGWDNIGWSRLCFNYEQIHYNTGNMVSNHGELMEPILGTLWHTREKFAARSKAFYGMDGLCYPSTFSNRGNIYHYHNICMQVSTAGEAAHLFWEYYEFTHDQEFLRRAGYLVLRDVATFYQQYLQEDENKQLYIFPSYYTEDSRFALDSITDQVMFRATFERAALAAEALGVDAEKANAWRVAAGRMRPLAADRNGLWTMHDSRNPANESFPKHNLYTRAFLQLYPIFPGDMVNRWHGPEELRKQAELNYGHWLGRHPEAWDKSFAYLDAARMGDREYYPAMLRGACAKLTEYGNITDSAEVQLFKTKGYAVDSGSAFPAGVLSEFLLNSQFGEIRLFPAMPLNGSYAFHSLRARGAFLVSSEFRDGKVPYVLLKSLAGNPCTVIQPFEQGEHVVVRELGTGMIVAAASNAKVDQPLSFNTLQGHLYVVERKDIPLEKVPLIQH